MTPGARAWVALIGAIVALAGTSACQTPAQPRAWHDEFTGEHGEYVFASRQSGGHDVRFVVTDADPEHLVIRVRTARSPVHGRMTYFIVDGKRYEHRIEAKSYSHVSRPPPPRGMVGLGASRGVVSTGFHTGVGVSFGHRPVQVVTHATVRVPIDFAHRLIESEAARFRLGEASGPRYELSTRTRGRIADLINYEPPSPDADE